MQRHQKIIVFGATVLLIFALAVIWEFALEHSVGQFFDPGHRAKTVAEKWEFIAVSIFYAALAGAIFTFIWGTTLAGKERAEQSRRNVEARFYELVEDSQLGVHISARDGTRLFINRACAKMFGYQTPEELLATPAYSLISPGDMEYISAHRNAVYDGDPAPPCYEFQGRRKDGTIFTVEAYAQRTVWQGQDAIHRILIDVTERKQAETSLQEVRDELERRVRERTAELQSANTALSESEERYRQLVQISLDAIVVRDRERYLFANPAAARLLGAASATDLIGRRWADTVHPDERDQSIQRFDQIAAEGVNTRPVDRRLLCLDGSEVFVETQGTPIKWYGRTASLGVMRDITERKRAERDLRQARDEAERANAAKSRILAAASHDLRQPLQALQLFIGLLEDKFDDPVKRRIIFNMQQSTGAMEELLHALLDISKLDAGAVEPELVDFPVSRILENAHRMSAPLVAEKNITLSIVSSHAVVRSDPVLLEQIVQNFLSNAIAHSGAERVLLGGRRRNGALRIEVWDNGKGIPEGEQENIFEEFYQLDNPARTRRKGVGLGLAIADRTAHLLGHPVALSSSPGAGSVFSVEVPMVRNTALRDHPRKRVKAADRMPENAFVIVIEDDPNVLIGLRMLLEASNCDVIAASSAEKAAAALTECGKHPGAVIADYRLGEGKLGTDAIRLIQQVAGEPIPGIVLTGDTSPDRIRETRASGFLLMHKPVQAAKLIAVLAEVLNPAI